MKMCKRIAIAFSLYSRIPMPVFTWEDKDYHNAIAFLPLVGVVIGTLETLLILLASFLGLSQNVLVPILAVVPIIITGGFHLDGYMDVSDALSSYQDKDKCLEIMKDPHIGAFAVISLVKYGLVYIASLFALQLQYSYEISTWGIKFYVAGFVVVRALCGLTSLYIPKARKDGMLSGEAGNSDNSTRVILWVFALAGIIFMLISKPVEGVIVTLSLFIYTWYYKMLCTKRFGGVTGDTAGFYICGSELVLVAVMALLKLLNQAVLLLQI